MWAVTSLMDPDRPDILTLGRLALSEPGSEIRSVTSLAADPVGIIDIGSNSIRLVVFEAVQRNPVPLFNEKVLCAIGRNMATSHVLDPEGLRRARRTLKRFRAVADAYGIDMLHVVATAAARDATNGEAFVAEAETLTRSPVRLLSGEEEAAYAADGVLSGIPGAEGLVGDLGGGSLELTRLIAGERGAATTLKLGPLRLMDMAGGKVATARQIVDDALGAVPWLGSVKGQPLFAVGGVWRNIARLHMAQKKYPLHVLQHYTIEASDARDIARLIASQGKKSLQSFKGVARHRIDTIPYGALVLEHLILKAGLSRVVVSSYGLREGLLFSLLSQAQRAQDPLIEAAREIARTIGRSPRQVEELIAWSAPLFALETPAQARLRSVACLLSDIAWRFHPDYRAEQAFDEVLTAPFVGLDHAERSVLALTLHHRYMGAPELDRTKLVKPIVSDEDAQRAKEIGLALRLGHTLSASMPGILRQCPISVDDESVVLKMTSKDGALSGESVDKRLAALAETMSRTPRLIDGR